ncbi:MAG: hypothetical protein D6728_08510 [Cyanobacteria bacterium J055]|nr:MAG: hypothetical protein D6728_08510 [Cyanobacteria bacterium J055]
MQERVIPFFMISERDLGFWLPFSPQKTAKLPLSSLLSGGIEGGGRRGWGREGKIQVSHFEKP